MITLKFENGAIGVIDNCREAVYGYDQRVEVLGKQGMRYNENNYPNTATVSTAAEVRRDLPLNFFMERYTESYVSELQHFVDAILNDRPVPVTGRDGRISAAMGVAARTSYEENRPVRLAEIVHSIRTGG